MVATLSSQAMQWVGVRSGQRRRGLRRGRVSGDAETTLCLEAPGVPRRKASLGYAVPRCPIRRLTLACGQESLRLAVSKVAPTALGATRFVASSACCSREPCRGERDAFVILQRLVRW